MTKLLSRWFCFVQNSHGKIAAVYHSTSENNQAITFKKGVAAAFQANFDDTEEEEETDPGSTHTSHYTYVRSITCMHYAGIYSYDTYLNLSLFRQSRVSYKNDVTNDFCRELAS